MKKLICLLILTTSLAQARTQADEPAPIIGIRCEDHWDHYQIAGVKGRFMEPVSLKSLSVDLLRDLLTPTDPTHAENGELGFHITIGSCTASRTGDVLFSCSDDFSVSEGLSFSHQRRLREGFGEVITVQRSVGISNIRVEVARVSSSDPEKAELMFRLSADVELADGRRVAYKHERPFGKLAPDDTPDSNWGRRCSFITQWASFPF